MGLDGADLLDDGDGGGGKAASSVSCSICLDVVTDNGNRSWAKLQCGHLFHLGGNMIDVVLVTMVMQFKVIEIVVTSPNSHEARAWRSSLKPMKCGLFFPSRFDVVY
ncbi:unnamed protein product [Ilex paraguariensis]|uniref:RING-type domain-containing protein n=1 Tax=Ilex paraguariensis TaxID=185542 RepID=A0ABC8RUM5_9AQUA